MLNGVSLQRADNQLTFMQNNKVNHQSGFSGAQLSPLKADTVSFSSTKQAKSISFGMKYHQIYQAIYDETQFVTRAVKQKVGAGVDLNGSEGKPVVEQFIKEYQPGQESPQVKLMCEQLAHSIGESNGSGNSADNYQTALQMVKDTVQGICLNGWDRYGHPNEGIETITQRIKEYPDYKERRRY